MNKHLINVDDLRECVFLYFVSVHTFLLTEQDFCLYFPLIEIL